MSELLFQRYQVLKELGEGSFGKVYLVQDTTLNITLALKVMKTGVIIDPTEHDKFSKKFYRELKSIASLNHPNIIRVFGGNQENNSFYFTMNYVDGLSLDQHIKVKRKFSPREAAQITAQVARAIHYMHQQQIIHRDIKPANILLDQTDTPYLTDFGLAKPKETKENLTKTNEISGTLYYMSPEQLNGNVSEQSDIYSLGATLYELLTNTRMFPKESNIQLIMNIANERPISPSQKNNQISQDLENICLKSIEKKEANRYSTAEEFAKDLERFIEGFAPLAKAPKIPVKEIIAKYKKIVALIVAIFVVSIGAFGVALYKNKQIATKNFKIENSYKILSKNIKSLQTQKKLLEQENNKVRDLLKVAKWNESLNRGVLPKELGSIDNIEKVLGSLIKTLPSHEIQITWGRIYIAYAKQSNSQKDWLQNLNSAIKKLKQALKSSNNNEAAIFTGYTAASILNNDKDKYFFIDQLPDKPSYIALKNALKTKSRQKKIQLFSQAIKLNAKLFPAYELMAEELLNSGSFAQSIALFAKALRHNPQLTNSYTKTGTAHEKLAAKFKRDNRIFTSNSHYVDAISYYKKATKKNPHSQIIKLKQANCFFLLAQLYHKQKNNSKALQTNKKAYKLAKSIFFLKTKKKSQLKKLLNKIKKLTKKITEDIE